MNHEVFTVPSDAGVVFCDRILPSGPIGGWVVLVHGGGFTGASYLRTPDDRPGWAIDLARRGFAVVVPDWPGTGRSSSIRGQDPSAQDVVDALAAVLASLPAPATVVVHSMSGPFGFRLLEQHRDRVSALLAIAPGPPGNIQDAAEIIRQNDEEVTVRSVATEVTLSLAAPFHPDRDFVIRKYLGRTRRFDLQKVDRLAAGVVGIPASLLRQRLNVGRSQVRIEDTERLRGARILILTGELDAEHPRDLDERTANWLRECGALVDFVFADDDQLGGNGHMPMLEDNSAEWASTIADWIAGWRREEGSQTSVA